MQIQEEAIGCQRLLCLRFFDIEDIQPMDGEWVLITANGEWFAGRAMSFLEDEDGDSKYDSAS